MVTTPLEWLSETQITSGAFEFQDPYIVQLSSGNVLIAWTTNDDSGVGSPASNDIIGQIFDPFGDEVGTEFRLNRTRNADSESNISIAALPGGGFTVTYLDIEATGGFPIPSFDTAVVVDNFNNAGIFQNGSVISEVTGNEGFLALLDPDIKATSDTNALVVWYDSSTADVMAQRYNPSTGTEIGAEIVVRDLATGTGEGVGGVEVIALDNGNYAVGYIDLDNGADNDDVYVRIVNGSTGTVGTELLVFDDLADSSDLNMTKLTDGRVVMTWVVDGSGGSNTGIRARIINENGTTAGSAFTPATTTAGNQLDPAVVALDDGGFVIFWADQPTFDLHGQRYDSAGARVGSEFHVENFSNTELSNIEATLLEDGRVQLTWEAEFSGGDDVYTAIWDAREDANPTPVYDDNVQIGTPGGDFFDVDAGTDEAYGHTGNDIIRLNSTDEVGTLYDGGAGTDTLQLRNPGTYSLTNSAITNFEELKFNTGAGTGLRNVDIFASQFAQFDTLDFAGASTGTTGYEDRIEIIMGAQTSVDYSGLTIQDFNSTEDEIIINGDSSNETITGTSVNDRIIAGGGVDTLDGDGGIDTLDLRESYTGGATVNLANGTINSADGAETAVNFENVFGNSGNDDFTGTTGANVLSGGGGNDTLRGGNGRDEVFGDAGDDRLFYNGTTSINNGVEVIDGGADTDTLVVGGVSTGNETIDFGTETIVSIEEIEFGDTTGAGDVNLTLSFDADQFGGSGISLTANIDGFNATGHTETLDIDMESVTSLDLSGLTFQDWGTQDEIVRIDGDASAESIVGTSQEDEINGGAGNDILIGGNGDDVLNGGDDDDVLTGSGGTDELNGGAGNDTVNYSGNLIGAATYDLNAQQYTGAIVETWSSIENVDSGNGADTVILSSVDNVVNSGAGDDLIQYVQTSTSSTNIDTLDAGSGVDTFEITALAGERIIDLDAGVFATGNIDATNFTRATLAGFENVTVAGAQDVRGDSNANVITATGSFANEIEAGGGDDFVNASAGNDDVRGGDGIDTLDGGDGDDELRGQDGEDILLGGIGDDFLSGGENNDFIDGGDDNDELSGGRGNDELRGGDGDDILRAGTANDDLFGGDGDDDLFGTRGRDALEGGAGGDLLDGGGGIDRATYNSAVTAITVDLANGALNSGDAAGDTYVSIENIVATEFNDTLRGDALDNEFTGGSGNDSLEGRAGDDILNGGRGIDTLDGGADDDTLTGSTGGDTFVFEDGDGDDVITDFRSGGPDRIQIAGETFGSLTISDSSGDALIEYGSGDSILLTGIDETTLVQSDFIFV